MRIIQEFLCPQGGTDGHSRQNLPEARFLPNRVKTRHCFCVCVHVDDSSPAILSGCAVGRLRMSAFLEIPVSRSPMSTHVAFLPLGQESCFVPQPLGVPSGPCPDSRNCPARLSAHTTLGTHSSPGQVSAAHLVGAPAYPSPQGDARDHYQAFPLSFSHSCTPTSSPFSDSSLTPKRKVLAPLHNSP